MNFIEIKKSKDECEKIYNDKLQQEIREKEKAKKGIKEIMETNLRIDKFLSTTVYEIIGIVNQLKKDKHRGLTATDTQNILNRLVDVATLRDTVGIPMTTSKENYHN